MADDQLRIRPATAADRATIARLDGEVWSSTSSPAPRPGPDRDPFERRPPADHLLAELSGRVVGCVQFGHPTPLDASRHVLEVQGLSVAHDARGRGVGRQLMLAALDEARRRGARKVSLRVLATNPVAQDLYRSLGFTVEGHLRGEFLIDGEEVDDLLMAVRLTAAS